MPQEARLSAGRQRILLSRSRNHPISRPVTIRSPAWKNCARSFRSFLRHNIWSIELEDPAIPRHCWKSTILFWQFPPVLGTVDDSTGTMMMRLEIEFGPVSIDCVVYANVGRHPEGLSALRYMSGYRRYSLSLLWCTFGLFLLQLITIVLPTNRKIEISIIKWDDGQVEGTYQSSSTLCPPQQSPNTVFSS